MKTIKYYLTSAVLLLLCLAALMWVSTWNGIRLTSVEVSYNNQDYQTITLPFSQDHIGPYIIRATLEGFTQNNHSLRIYPDDEIHTLKVNGTYISLDGLSHEQKRDYGAGFVVNLNNLQINAPNIVEAQLSNNSNPAGFRMESAQRISIDKLQATYYLLLVLLFVLARHLPLRKSQLLIAALGLLLCVFYLSKTDERTRTFDVFEGGGHKDYIEYLIKHKDLPIPGDGWEYHQPPLYYFTAALAKVSLGIDSSTHGDLWGQLLGLFFWTIFLASGLATLGLAFRRQRLAFLLTSLAFALWPAGIIHSIRIGNDLALYAFYGLAFYYTLKWWRTRDSTTLFWASLWMAASLLTKSNGLAVAGILGLLMLIHIYSLIHKPALFEQHKKKLIRDMCIAGGLFIGAILLNFADNVKHYLDGTSEDWLLSNVSEMINPGLKVNNDVPNYLIFDSATFIQKPFISTWDDAYGRQYFWNFVWRSSLSSEFFFDGEGLQAWGVINGILLLLALAGTAIYYLQQQPQLPRRHLRWKLYRHAPWVMALIFPFILLLAYRIKVPLSCNTDFRYIYPVLVALLFFIAQAWCKLPNQKRLWLPFVLTLGIPLIAINSIWWIALLVNA